MRQVATNSAANNDHVYNNQKRRKRRKRHHRFCMKCVTSSFASLFRVLKEPIAITSDTIKKTEVINPQVPKGKAQYADWVLNKIGKATNKTVTGLKCMFQGFRIYFV